MPAPELRRDPVIGRWIIVSTERTQRPTDLARAVPADDSAADCPFCPGHENRTPPEVVALREPGTAANAPGWRRRVFRSLAPLVTPEDELAKRGEGMFDMMSGFGEHEVIVDAPDHAASLATLGRADLIELVLLWRARFRALKANPAFRCLTLFANRGAIAGAAIAHSHSQIIATPILPRRLAEEMSMGYAYFQAKERCVFCDIQDSDLGGERCIAVNDSFAALAPYAPRFPYEIWLMPRAHASHFEDLGDAEAAAFAEILGRSFRALQRALNDPPYSFVLHAAPPQERGMVHYHWHLEIMPRLSNVAGFEWGTGFYINSVPPELAAALLRQHADG